MIVFRLVFYLREIGNVSESIELIKKYIEIDEASSNYGYFNILLGNFEEANIWLKKKNNLSILPDISPIGLLCINLSTIPGIYNLVHKVELAKLLKKNNLEYLAPRSYIVSSKDDVVAAIKEYESNNSSTSCVYYLKDPLVQR